MSPDIRKIVSMRDLKDVKVIALYNNGKCTIEVQYEDGTSSKMLFYGCNSFPTTTSVQYNIGGYLFNISKTVNSCAIYTGENHEEASIMLLEHLLTMFKSSKVHLDLTYFRENALRTMMTCEAFNYVPIMNIANKVDLKGETGDFHQILMENLTLPQSRQLLPEYRPIVSGNRFRTESAERWMEDFKYRKCPIIQLSLEMNQTNADVTKSAMRSWQQGAIPIYQNLRFECNIDKHSARFPHLLSITDGLENLTSWDKIGKMEMFDTITGKRLLHGYDFTISRDLCASYMVFTKMDREYYEMEFVFWRAANAI